MSETTNSEVNEEIKKPARLSRPARFHRDMAEARKLRQYAAELRNIADKLEEMGLVNGGVCSGISGEAVREATDVVYGFVVAAERLAHVRAGR